MPKYEYGCNTCSASLTDERSIKDEDDIAGSACYHCPGGVLKRVYGPTGVQFKGKGFYSTDHA